MRKYHEDDIDRLRLILSGDMTLEQRDFFVLGITAHSAMLSAMKRKWECDKYDQADIKRVDDILLKYGFDCDIFDRWRNKT